MGRSSISKDILDRIEEIKTDNINSSIVLTRKLVDILLDFIQIEGNPSIEEIKELIFKMVETQPMMASILNFCNRILVEIDKQHDSIKKTVIDYCNRFLLNLDNQTKGISSYAFSLIDDGMKIATYSYSVTVAEALEYTKKYGKNFIVICSESRPSNEGILLARYLGKKGIKTILVTDAMLFSIIGEADMIFVGADSINKNGVINKIGTSSLAKIAFHENIPFYHLCSTDKILPYNYPIIKEPDRDPKELLREHIDNVIVRNRYFDTTSINYITGVITEQGVLSKDRLLETMESYSTHPDLLSYFLSRDK
ncbi:MAG: hypothetical protein DRN12_07690 [Thermoplasmata archaeon]|nr:MAG: hypothetical protein DRN12_07690 [Thermoplasmata archaeon]